MGRFFFRMSVRVTISRRERFDIFRRDSFKCRYCGRTSEDVTLEVDHVIPVCEGGTNDEANLVTACFDCNRGKRGTLLDAPLPSATDWLQVLQERRELLQQAEQAREAATAREDFEQEICNFWCEQTRKDGMSRQTLTVMVSFAKRHGVAMVYDWIQTAVRRLPGKGDARLGRYISGIRNGMIERGELVDG